MSIAICAAEDSGAALGVTLVEALRARGETEFFGLAPPALRAAGVEPVSDPRDLAVTGVVEAAAVIGTAWRTQRALIAEIARRRPRVLVTIDAPSLLLRVAGAARARGIPTVHWVCPQVWAWRMGRVRRIAQQVDTLLCTWPFEPPLFSGLPTRAVFVGHPAVDRMRVVPPGSGLVLAPGSRGSEVRTLWPIFRAAAERVPGPYFVPVAPSVDRALLTGLDVTFVDDITTLRGRAALTCTGTVSLELALLGIPQVAVYRAHPLTASLARRILRLRSLALPNVLLGRRAVPERHQHLDPAELAALLGVVEGSPPLLELRDVLGGGGSADRSADEVLRAAR